MVVTRTNEGRNLGCQRCGLFEASMRFQQEEIVLLWFKDFDILEKRARTFKKKYCKECMSRFALLINNFDNEIHGVPMTPEEKAAMEKANKEMADRIRKELLKDEIADINTKDKKKQK